jgi:hypothetical protein
MTGNEVSSKGYENFLHFYSFLQDLKRKFVRFFVDRTYYNDPKKMVNFVTEDEKQNIYHARSRLPENFWKGVIINSVWVILLLLLGNFLFKRRMFPVLKKPETTEIVKTDFHDTEKVEIVCIEPGVAEITDQITNVFFGHTKSFKGNLSIEGESIVTKEKKPALFLSHPDTYPEDLKGRNLLKLHKRSQKLTNDEYKKLRETAGLDLLDKPFAKMNYMEKADVLLAIIKLKKWKIIILHNFAFGLNAKERFILTNKLKALGIDDVLIISIITKGDNWLQPDRYINIAMKEGKIAYDCG